VEKNVQFRVLGSFEARSSESGAVDFGHRKVRALLVYLAVEGKHPQSREHLATLLWGRTGDERSRHNLRQALSKIRSLFPTLIETTSDGVALNSEICAIDMVAFEDLAKSDNIEELKKALELYRGDLLEGYNPREPDYQDWLQIARGRLHKLACEVADRLATLLGEQGRSKDAIEVFNRLLHLDPANEAAHRGLMKLLAQLGRRSEALRQYQECVSALARELDAEPSLETRQLLAELRSSTTSEPSIEFSKSTSMLSVPGKPSLVVKPFANISADSAQDYFAEGLTKDISIALVKIPGIFLAWDESPAAHLSRQMAVTELGREFGVRYVLTGGVRKQGDRVRVNAELIEATSGRCLWAERYDRDLHDLFLIQDEITEEIVTAMDVKLMRGEAARFLRTALANPAALDLAYRGWHALYNGGSRQHVREAQHFFEEVIKLEPESPIGYASAALAHWTEAGFGRVVLDSPAMDRAVDLARKALGHGDTTGFANMVLALNHLARHEYDQAMAQATEGVAARPSCNGAYSIKSSVLNYLGRPQEAIEFAQYAVRLTPVYPADFPAILAAAYHDSGRHVEAIEAANTSLKLRQGDIDPLLILTASNVALGNLEKAREAAAIIKTVEPGFCLSEYAATQPYSDPKDLERLIDRLRESGLDN